MWRSLRMALVGLFRRDRMERDMADELQFHLEQRTEALIRTGLPHEEAERRARVEFGALEAHKDRCRDERGWRFGDELRNDARYAWRMLRKNPTFAFVAIATLAIGIGANAAIFSIVNGVLLRPLPYSDPERLTMIYESSTTSGGFSTAAYPNFLDWQESARSFTHMAAYCVLNGALDANGEVEHVRGLFGSADLLSVLGIAPVVGRAFSSDEDKPNGAPVVLISYGLWQKRYAGSSQAIGKRLQIDAETYTIVGVLPESFRLRRADVVVPLAQRKSPAMQARDMRPAIHVIARLKSGVTLDQARTEMEGIAKTLAERYPKTNTGRTIALRPLLDDVVGDARLTLFLLLAAVCLVLLIACANVANLLLARAESRRRELAMRAALGAGVSRLIRQLVAESVLLSLIGGAGGLLPAMLGTRALLQQLPVTLPRAQDVGVDWRVVAFTFAASLLTGLLFGLAPALQSARIDVLDALKIGARSVIGGRSRARGLFVVVQLALGLVLLVSTGLLLRTLWQLSRVDPGFDLHGITTMRVGLPKLAASEPDVIRRKIREIVEHVEHVPGVERASLADTLPLSGDSSDLYYWTGSPPAKISRAPTALLYLCTPHYFDVLKVPLRSGRLLTWDDTRREAQVVLVDEVLAQHAFPGQNPLGQTISFQVGGKAQIAGVVGHIKHFGVDRDDRAEVRDQIYVPMAYVPDAYFHALATVGETLLIRSRLEPNQLLPAVRSAIQAVSGTAAIFDVRTFEDIAAERTARRRFLAIVLGLFASIAMMLAAVGVHGVMAYSVSQRVQEIGIRMALGASARQILDQILGQGVRLVVVGLAAGVIAAVLATRFLSSLLFGVSATDPLTFAAVAALLVAVALLACAVPAFRAVRIEPTTALRQE